MNNFKKIGMTALAASLVSTSVFAGELTVSGSASLNVEAHSGTALNEAKAYTMGNQITFSGSTDLENGLNVAMSYVLDQGDDVSAGAVVASAKGPFDGHSITLTHDTLGTIKFSGEGGSSTATSIDGTAAGDMWDNFNSNGGTTVTDSSPGDNSFFYTAPVIVDGLGINLSYKPQAIESATGYGLSYTVLMDYLFHTQKLI
jgi:outer membrane protein OmpU